MTRPYHPRGAGPRPQLPIEHGTPKGYQRCRHLPDGPCDRCKAAHAERMREYRAAAPAWLEANNRRSAARTRAMERLREQHPEQFAALFALELERLEAEAEAS